MQVRRVRRTQFSSDFFIFCFGTATNLAKQTLLSKLGEGLPNASNSTCFEATGEVMCETPWLQPLRCPLTMERLKEPVRGPLVWELGWESWCFLFFFTFKKKSKVIPSQHRKITSHTFTVREKEGTSLWWKKGEYGDLRQDPFWTFQSWSSKKELAVD